MTSQQLSFVIQSAFALAVLLWMLLDCLPSHRLDVFRQRMFVVRDDLFDYARAGNIGFDHPAYRLLRKSMNGFIRYGHRLSFFQLCVTFCRWHFSEEKPVSLWQKQWGESIRSIEDQEVKQRLVRFHTQSMNIVTGRLVSGSPVLIAVLIVLIFGTMCHGAWKSTADLYRSATERLFNVFPIGPDALEDEALRSAA